MSKRFVTGLVLSLALAAPAAAQQRPLVTEDPETIGSGLILFEGGFDLQQEIFYPVSGLQGDLLRLPTLGLSFGLSQATDVVNGTFACLAHFFHGFHAHGEMESGEGEQLATAGGLRC